MELQAQPNLKGETQMRSKSVILMVAVVTGSVSVAYYGLNYVLKKGEQQSFPEEKGSAPPVAVDNRAAPSQNDPSAGNITSKAGAFPQDLATAGIKGTVTFAGTPPPRLALDTSGDPKCAAHHKEPLLREDVIVTDGKLKNVIVYVKKGTEKWTFSATAEPAVLDQRGCQYSPHVFGMMVNQPLLIKNSDDLAHNIHAVATINQEFNESQPRSGLETIKFFSQPEMPVKIQCDVHRWMGAFIGVFSHPFFAVTGEDGSYVINGLPPGQYEIEAWQESKKLDGPHSATITLGDKEAKVLNFNFTFGAKK